MRPGSGASNRNNDGRSFEKDLQQICKIYAEQHRGYFEKVEPPVRIIGWGPARKVIFLENPFLDFCGVHTENNRIPLFFEAKSTIEPTLPIGGERSLKATQITAMATWREFGAGTFLLWEMRGECRLFFQLMIETAQTERKSLVFDDGLPVPAGKGFIFWGFLTLIRQYPDML